MIRHKIRSAYHAARQKVGLEKAAPRPESTVRTINGGVLKGARLFVDPDGAWKDMLSGTYDSFFFEYLRKLGVEGKTIFDIGSHIGYHALAFARLVGERGHVHAFEPNPFNLERLQKNVSANPELSGRIEAHRLAISDKKAPEEFIFNERIDKGSSSGSFLDRADTVHEKSSYEAKGGFKRMPVETESLDGWIATSGVRPDLIKIDIEGAEHLAIAGAADTLKNVRPVFLIEIHTILNMFKVSEALHATRYRLELLGEDGDGRCFIVATADTRAL